MPKPDQDIDDKKSASAPLVSILVPCYNSAAHLEKTVQSALDQTYSNTEIIVVDDGSTDGSMQKISHIEDRRLKRHRQTNQGHSAAVNVAFAQSTGDYIKYLDADDIISRDHVALQVERLRASPRAVAMGEWARFYSDDPNDANFVAREMYRDADPGRMAGFRMARRSTNDAMRCIPYSARDH